jgi:hypothetical protein
MAHNTFVFKQAIDITLSKARDFIEIKVVKGRAKIFTFGENSAPA